MKIRILWLNFNMIAVNNLRCSEVSICGFTFWFWLTLLGFCCGYFCFHQVNEEVEVSNLYVEFERSAWMKIYNPGVFFRALMMYLGTY